MASIAQSASLGSLPSWRRTRLAVGVAINAAGAALLIAQLV